AKTAALLEKKGLLKIEDLIYFLPRRYEDRRFPVNISQARVGVRETITGTVTQSEIKFYGKRPVFEATIEDGTGFLKAKWFKGGPAYLRQIFKKGNRVIFTGETGLYSMQKEMVHPDFEILDQESDNLLHFKRIVPIYSETEGLYQKNLRRTMKQVVDEYASCVLSPIPEEICKRHRLIEIGEAIMQAHFPTMDQNVEDYNAGLTAAHRRLIFDEFFFFQLAMALKKRTKPGKRHCLQNRRRKTAKILQQPAIFPNCCPAAGHRRDRTGHGQSLRHEQTDPGRCRMRQNGGLHGRHGDCLR
ncbi:MAG: hypothetical protein Q8O44_02570, partial [Syntrophales bacterium]|nr:hypothetical protein [Syntrophales bacterium]